jgi:hypothetical protein
MVHLLAGHSRDLRLLCYRGFVDRVREVLRDDPATARVVDEGGHTTLWWLPDDETAALEIAELLLAAGADPVAKNQRGETAAERARRLGMLELGARLERQT